MVDVRDLVVDIFVMEIVLKEIGNKIKNTAMESIFMPTVEEL